MTHPSPGRSASSHWVRRYALPAAVAGLLALGTWFRLDGITGSLWIDEFGTFWVVEGDLGTVIQRTLAFQGQSPFYYLLAWIPIHLFGESEVALRGVSLLSGVLFVVALYAGGRAIAGPRAGRYAAALGWLSSYSLASSVEARPYALVLLGAAVAIAAFCSAVRSGGRGARAMWILGGASVAWAHYVHYPLVMGLFAAYALLPDLRAKYTPRRFLLDGLAQGVLVALCVPQILALLARQGTLAWSDGASPFVFVWPLLPLLPAIVLGLGLRDAGRDRVDAALHRGLWICLLSQVGTLEVAALAGINLLSVRYFVSILAPGALLASVALSRLRWREAAAGFLIFGCITGGEIAIAKRGTGTFSGVGYEDWKGAVTALAGRLPTTTGTPLVLFRSGLVEEDVAPLGKPGVVTLSPLRSPGREAFPWPVTSLTFRWDNPARKAYFDEAIAPAVQRASQVFVLSPTFSTEPVSYVDQFMSWVEDTWPGRFQVTPTGFGSVALIEFTEKRDPR